MSSTNTNKTEVNLILLDDDPIFLLGLREVLKGEKFKDINVIATGKIADFSVLLTQDQNNLWVVSLDFYKYPSQSNNFLKSLEKLNIKYPDLSLVILLPWGFVGDFSLIPAIKGYCYKNSEIDELVKIFRACALGETCFYLNNSVVKSQNIYTWFNTQIKLGLKQIQEE
ncbi:hypothetical protein, partial [Geminocystis sp. GBBB08]|uniref:hypothetical protein n=1 Tax=Geminocystis sp. GBBB08 TaxID=2604140 RepID=UPI0027E2EA0E